jgi:hypothetical protein
MAEGSGTPASSESSGSAGSSEKSLVGLMPDVVKGLMDKPPLLFGIGAGVILVVVLGATADVWLVLIVAAVLVLALGAWLVIEARRLRNEAARTAAGGVRQTIHSEDVETAKGATAANVRSRAPTAVEQDLDLKKTKLGEGSSLASVDFGASPEHENRE